jgi:Concanavalin A-like lectin/glucanases superfamily
VEFIVALIHVLAPIVEGWLMTRDRRSWFRNTAMLMLAVSYLSADADRIFAGMYSSAVLADNPAAYYRLDETTGNTATNIGTGSGINGTYVNIPGMTVNNSSNYGQAGPRPATFPGFETSNNSVYFDPENGSTATSTTFPRVEVPVADGSSPLAITGALTLEAWINVGDDTVGASNNEGIVGRYLSDGDPNTAGTQPGRAYVLYYDSGTDGSNGTPDGTPGLGFALSSTGSFQSANSYEFAANLPIGEWAHVAVVYDPGNRIEAYVNGNSIATITTGVLNSPLFSGMADFWIGQQFTGQDIWTFEGSIDEVAVYAAALSDEQIAAHYHASQVPEPVGAFLALFGLIVSSFVRQRSLG